MIHNESVTDVEATEAELLRHVTLAKTLISRCEAFLVGVAGSRKLQRKCEAELKYLNKISDMPQKIQAAHLLSSNLEFLKGIVEMMEAHDDISAVLKNVQIPQDSNVNKDHYYRGLQLPTSVCVDVIRSSGSVWVKVIAKHAQSLHLIWAGQGNYGSRSILDQANNLKSVAKLNPVNYKPPQICLHFRNGITSELKKVLEYNKYIVELSEDSVVEPANDDTIRRLCLFQGMCSDEEEEQAEGLTRMITPEPEEADGGDDEEDETPKVQKCNLDITALISLVSNLNTAEGCKSDFTASVVLAKQAKEELENPTLPALQEYIKDKDLYVCRTALLAFKNVLNTVGGSTEKLRGAELLTKVKVIEDGSTEKSDKLKVCGQVKDRAKIIFGTGDSIRAITITANCSFIRAARNQKVDFVVHQISPRALSEMKE